MEIIEISIPRTVYHLIVLLVVCAVIYGLAASVKFRKEALDMIQNGDEKTHTQDGFKLVTLFLAFLFGYLLGDLVVKSIETGEERLAFMAELFGFVAALLGVSFYKQK